MFILLILFTTSLANGCGNFTSGVVYGSDDDGNVYNTTIFESTADLLSMMCAIWKNPAVTDVNVQFTKNQTLVKKLGDSCNGLKRATVYGTNVNGFIIVVHVTSDLNDVVPLVCETWMMPYVVLVSVDFECC